MTAARKPLRFILVGITNTAIDFGLLFALRALGMPLIPANMISTGVALIFSFFANRSFTFGAVGGGRRAAVPQAVKFLAITLFGLWVLQPLVLLLGQTLLHGLSLHGGWQAGAALLASKLAATVVSMTWNYLMYDRVVFAGPRSDRAEVPD